MKHDSTVSLGKYANNAAQAGGVDPARARRYYLQNLAADLLPDERVSECLRAVAPSADQVDLFHNPARSSARYANLIVCSRVWTCPVCAARITEERRRELTLAAAAADLSLFWLRLLSVTKSQIVFHGFLMCFCRLFVLLSPGLVGKN